MLVLIEKELFARKAVYVIGVLTSSKLRHARANYETHERSDNAVCAKPLGHHFGCKVFVIRLERRSGVWTKVLTGTQW